MSVGSARGARLKHARDFSGSLLRSAATGSRGLCCQSERAVQLCICEKRWRDLRLEAKTEEPVFFFQLWSPRELWRPGAPGGPPKSPEGQLAKRISCLSSLQLYQSIG